MKLIPWKSNVPEVQNPMELLQIAVEQNVDADKLEKLMDLQDRYVAKLAEQDFNTALALFQANCPVIKCEKEVKSNRGMRYNYAPLEDIQETIRPYLQECGLSVSFSTKWESDGYLTAICYLTHVSGHTRTSDFTCPVDRDMKVNDSQKQGSVNSYAKRYALSNALNLVFEKEDDDGGSAQTQAVTPEQADEIRELVKARQVDEKVFFTWAGCNSYETIPASKYGQIIAEYKK